VATMLVVDDDAAWRALYRAHFGEQFELVEAADGVEALAVLDRTSVDLILLDVRMPRLDGASFLEALKRRASHPPVICCSAQPPDILRQRLPDVRVVEKTADLSEIWAAVRAVLPVSEEGHTSQAGGDDMDWRD
jgi:DNA-binding response OmpR family regulator